MGYREFADADGLTWKVWDVMPEARVRTARTPPEGGIQLPTGEARVENTPGHVAPGWEAGWLAFQCDTANRRLRPIPVGWETTSEDKLRFYLRASVTANNAKRPSRLPQEQ